MVQLKKPIHASLFDLDHTLLKVNSSASFGKYLYKKGVFSTFRFLQLGIFYLLYKIGAIPLSRMQYYVFRKLFYRQKAATFEAHVENFLDSHLDTLINPSILTLLQNAQQKGHFVAILSSSPHFLVHSIGRRWNVPQIQSTIYSVDSSGDFSGIKKVLQGQDKADWTRDAIEKLNLSSENVTVYSDSILDLPFLEIAGTKIIVNPDKKLMEISLQKGWEIM